MLFSPRFSRMLTRGAAGVFGWCGLMLLMTGCGGGGPDYKARAIIKGRVTVGKKNLTTGSVMFYNTNGITGVANIDPDGNYVMNDAPIGECKVTVTVSALPMDAGVRARLKGTGKGPKMPGEMKIPEGVTDAPPLPSAPSVPKEVVPIDGKYSKPETSGLTYKVEKGEHKHDIEL